MANQFQTRKPMKNKETNGFEWFSNDHWSLSYDKNSSKRVPDQFQTRKPIKTMKNNWFRMVFKWPLVIKIWLKISSKRVPAQCQTRNQWNTMRNELVSNGFSNDHLSLRYDDNQFQESSRSVPDSRTNEKTMKTNGFELFSNDHWSLRYG